LGRIVAMVYMGFGITIISVLLSVITSNFYKRRIEKEERLKKDHEQKYLRDLLLNKIEQIEEKQTQSNKVVLQQYDVLMKNNDNYGKP
jgi:heme exporter protein D